MAVVTPILLDHGGNPMDPAWELVSIDVRREVNRIPSAELLLVDGNLAKGKFRVSDEKFFEPGKAVEIRMRYEGQGGKGDSLFKGKVIRHGVEAAADGSSFLSVGLKDAAVKLTGARRSKVFHDLKDKEIIEKVLQKAGKNTVDVADTEPKHKEVVQYYCTDWDFVLSRADVNNLLVALDDKKIRLKKPEVSGSPKQVFDCAGDREIYSFEMEAEASHQFGVWESVAWDVKNQKLTKPKEAREAKSSQGDLKGDEVAKSLGLARYTLSHPVPVDDKELQAWSDARLAKGRMAMLRGRIAVAGRADLDLLDVIEVKGIGKRFNGRTFVTGIRHRYSEGTWTTDFQFGLSPEWFCREEHVADAPAAGLLPPAGGLQIGVVAKFEEDEDQKYRVRLTLPAVGMEKEAAVWARLAAPDAGKKRGFYFRPETGDEVVVGFLNDDPRHPVILGGLYSAKNERPQDLAAPSKDNVEKGIVTRKGTKIKFVDDKKCKVSIETPGKNKVIIDDDAEMIQLLDQHENSVTLNKDGVTIESKKGNVEIKGKQVNVK